MRVYEVMKFRDQGTRAPPIEMRGSHWRNIMRHLPIMTLIEVRKNAKVKKGNYDVRLDYEISETTTYSNIHERKLEECYMIQQHAIPS